MKTPPELWRQLAMLRKTSIGKEEILRRRAQAQAYYAEHGLPDEDARADHELFILGKMEKDEYEEYLAWKHAPGIDHRAVDWSVLEQAIFAGGCFWCMQEAFDAIDGVWATEAGYTGGTLVAPTYADVLRGHSGHYEAVRVTYKPSELDYASLLDVFWHHIDPTQADGQFSDRGPQYRTAIFCITPEQRRLAEASKQALERSGRFERPIATEIRQAGPFYPAEAEHQFYYRRYAQAYRRYREASGRQCALRRIWGTQGRESNETA